MTINFLLVGASAIVNVSNNEVHPPTTLFNTSSLSTTSKTNDENYKVSAHNGTKILIPSNINIRIFLVTKPIRLKRCVDNIHQQEDKVATILGLFVNAHARHMQRDASEVDDYIPFSSTILQHHVYDYADYLQYLMDNGILETDGFYIPDEKCNGYRFTEKYRYASLEEYFISDYKGNARNGAALCNSFYKVNSEQKNTINKYKELYEDLCNVSITNYETATEYILNDLKPVAYDAVIKDLRKKRDGTWSTYKNFDDETKNTFTDARVLGKQNSWIFSVHAIANKHLYFKQDHTSQRLHTSVLGVKSQCRKFVRLMGKEIISCDLKNSQPFISSFFFTEGTLTPEIEEVLQKCLRNIKIENIKLYKSIFKRIFQYKSGDILPSTKQYIKLVKDGEIYEFLAAKLNQNITENGKIHQEYTRQDGKYYTFTIFFNPANQHSTSRKIFRDHFPQVMDLFEDINILFTHTRKESDRLKIPYTNNTLAVLLQTIESHLILDVICKNMKEKYPHIPLLTVHDAIATNPEYTKPLEEEMQSAITEAIGTKPTIKLEAWI